MAVRHLCENLLLFTGRNMDDSHASPDRTSRSNRLYYQTSLPSATPAPGAEYSALTTARDHVELMESLGPLLRALQFSDFAFTLKNTANDLIYYFSTSAEANQYFHDLGDWELDISAMYATRGDQPLFQSSIDDYLASAPFATSSMAKSRAFSTLTRTLGFEEMYHIPLPLQGTGYAILTVGAKGYSPAQFHAQVANELTALQEISVHLGKVVPTLFNSSRLRVAMLPQLGLGHTSILLLNALAKDNLSLNAAAEMLCISISAANKHVASIKKNLKAKTIASAVYKAARLGLLD